MAFNGQFCNGLCILQPMLRLQKIIITHFKNYNITQFDFNGKVTGICGLNGRGKTNLLDAIYYCCFTKSYFTGSDSLCSGFGKDGFRLEAIFENAGKTSKITCIYRGNKKEFFLDDVQYEKLSSHIGLLPAVMVAPDDVEIITAGSEERRRYLDTIICQLDATYLQQLMLYNKILQQRNSQLKAMAEQPNPDLSLLDILDMQLAKPGNYIYLKRASFCSELIPLIENFYRQLANNGELVACKYESALHDSKMEEVLMRSRQKDRVLQRSSAGIHRDELIFELNGQPFKAIASQGQRKSLLFSLKLAEYELIKKHKGFSPLLLLDDVFEKLDDNRMSNLLHWVCNENGGQVFITDTHKQRLLDAFGELKVQGQIIEL